MKNVIVMLVFAALSTQASFAASSCSAMAEKACLKALKAKNLTKSEWVVSDTPTVKSSGKGMEQINVQANSDDIVGTCDLTVKVKETKKSTSCTIKTLHIFTDET